MAIVDVGHEGDVTPGNGLRVVVKRRPIAIFNVHDELYAIGDTCTHEEYSLADGELDERECSVECALHGARFDLRTGNALSLPGIGSTGSYHVWVEDGIIKLELPD